MNDLFKDKDDFVDKFGSYFDNQADYFTTEYDKTLKAFVSEMVNQTEEVWDLIKSKFDSFESGIDSLFGAAMDYAVDFVNGKIDQIKNKVTEIATTVKDYIKDKLNGLVTSVRSWVNDKISQSNALGAFANSLITRVVDVLGEVVQDTVTKVVDKVEGVINTALSSSSEALNDCKKVKDVVDILYPKIKEAIVDNIKELLDFSHMFTSLKDNLIGEGKEILFDLAKDLVMKGTEYLNSLIDSASGSITKFFKNLFNKIISAFSSKSSTDEVESQGSNFISQIKSWLASGIQYVTKNIDGIVAKVLKLMLSAVGASNEQIEEITGAVQSVVNNAMGTAQKLVDMTDEQLGELSITAI